jgi:O-antigen/teichoic acid export membrane protein
MVKDHLLGTLPYAGYAISSALILHLDSLFLSILVGSTALGLYQAPIRLIAVTQLIANSYVLAMLPRESRHYAQHRRVSAFTKDAMRYGTVFGIGVCSACFLLASPIISSIYGDGYLPATTLFKCLVFLIPLRYLEALLGVSLFAIGRAPCRLRVLIKALIASALLNLLFQPLFHAYAAAAIAVACGLFIVASYLRHNIDMIPSWSLPRVLAGTLAIGLLLVFSNAFVSQLSMWTAGLLSTIIAFLAATVAWIATRSQSPERSTRHPQETST